VDFDLHFWHSRFCQQASWTANLRNYFFNKFHFKKDSSVLEVGCGTGAILENIQKKNCFSLFGIDIHIPSLIFARQKNNEMNFACANGLTLPFPAHCFNITFCHYLLMWVKNAKIMLEEMQRVTQKGGFVIAFAEPDYGGRIDYPLSLEQLGKLQNRALEKMGASIQMGRQLLALFQDCGFSDIYYGVLQLFKEENGTRQSELEEQVMRYDLHILEKESEISFEEINRLLALDAQAWQAGIRLLYIPTFYCWGVNPGLH